MKQLQNKMKNQKIKYHFPLILLLVLGFCVNSFSQDSVAREMILGISYNLPDDNIPYLKISAKEKIERKFIPLKDITAEIYLGEASESGLLSKIKTDNKGESKVFIPASFKKSWDSISPLRFIAVTDANKDFESTTAEIEIFKSKIEMDTSSDEETKNIMVKLSEYKNGEWMPAQETEIRIVIKRLLGNLAIGEEETYTTDSSGMVFAAFIRDSLPGDSNGFITLMARTDESELYGNISTEKKVPWAVATKNESNYNKRSLWATAFRAPYWLLALAFSIIGTVWGILIYLIFQIVKIKRLGKVIN